MATTDAAPNTDTDVRARGSARQAVLLVLIAAALLVVFAGDSLQNAADDMHDGVVRTVVRALGKPAGAVADALPFAGIADQATGWLSSDKDLGSKDGTFSAVAAGGSSRVSPSAFASARPPLRSLLVTGDSMSQPLDAVLARSTSGLGVDTTRDAKIGTGISKTDLVDWGRLSVSQIRAKREDAVIVFLGANEGYPMTVAKKTVTCCGVDWAAEYATRVRAVIGAYLAGGAKKVYWLSIPAPRQAARARISGAVNRAIDVATAGFGTQVMRFDASGLFTPGFKYRDAMPVGGRDRIVRDPDGVHLNERGSEVLSASLLTQLRRDFAVR